MTTDLYQKLLLVNHIPAIEGIAGVQNLIKAFAYRGDMVMKKAKKFRKRGIKFLRYIERIDCMVYNNGDYLQSFKHGGKKDILFREKLLFYSRFCSVCGDYTRQPDLKKYRAHIIPIEEYKYPKCKCVNLIP